MKWEVVMEDNPRGQPSPMYRGLVALVSCSPSIAVVTTDGSTVESDQWENVARLIARAPEQAARIAALESESAQYREAAEKAEKECERLRGVIERDRSLAATVFGSFQRAASAHGWIIESRGSYEYDDDRYRREFADAMHTMERAIEPLRRLVADWSDCSTTIDEIRKARAALRGGGGVRG
jgi:multidrug resistance efflux pump